MKKIYYVVYGLLILALFSLYACNEGSSDGGSDNVGDETFEGIDSDGDGVRDDVRKYIEENYEDEATIKALMRYAKAEQDFILAGKNRDKVAANASTRASDRARECLRSMHTVSEIIYMTDDVNAAISNTPERIRAYIVADSLLSGEVFESVQPEDRAGMCE